MIIAVSHLRLQPRHQTIQHSLQQQGRDQTMRLWRLWRTHQLDREHVRWHLDIHERELFFTSVSQRLFNVVQPERIQGADYTVKSDVWSLGISLIELANGRFPFCESNEEEDEEEEPYPIPDAPDSDTDLGQEKTPTHGDTSFPPHRSRARSSTIKTTNARKRKSTGVSLHGEGMTMSILELMHQIVNEPAPRLCMPGSPEFAPDAIAFVDACLIKLPEERKMPKALLAYEWMDWARRSTFDVRGWANSF